MPAAAGREGGPTVEARIAWIFGSPRSGSTWLVRMAKRHPAVEALEEPTIGYYLGPFLSNEPGYSAEDLDLSNFTARRATEGHSHRFFAAEYSDVWIPGLRRLLNDRFRAHLERETEDDGNRILLVKEPNGSQSADVIMRAQPEARLVFLLRDGRDVVDSELASFLVGGWQHRHFPHMRGIGEEERLRFVIDSAHQWLWRTEIVEAAFAEHSGPKHMLRYEELLATPELELKRFLEWLGVDLKDIDVAEVVDRLAFDRLKVRGADKFNRSASPGAWRENLRPDEQEAVVEILGPKLGELGYQEG